MDLFNFGLAFLICMEYDAVWLLKWCSLSCLNSMYGFFGWVVNCVSKSVFIPMQLNNLAWFAMQWQPKVQRSQLFVVCFQHTEISQSFKWCLTQVENSLPWIFLNLNWELFVNDWNVYPCCLETYDPASCPKPAGIGSLIKKEKSFLMIANDSILAFFFLFFVIIVKWIPLTTVFFSSLSACGPFSLLWHYEDLPVWV